MNSEICNKCNFRCCPEYLSDNILCESCLDDLCPICKKKCLNGSGNDEKYCIKCDRICCIDCISVTGCQTIYGTCKECFSHLCISCNQETYR